MPRRAKKGKYKLAKGDLSLIFQPMTKKSRGIMGWKDFVNIRRKK